MTRIAMPVAADYEDSELDVPYDTLRKAGHEVVLVGLEKGERLAGKRGESSVTTDVAVADVDADDFDALVVPGGYSPDKLRTDERMVAFVRAFGEADKPVAAICHGPQLLIEAGLVEGRTLTSWPSVRTDLENAGATWKDREVVEDGNLITSRKPEDLDAFCAAIESELAAVAGGA
jgi:protease I